MSLEVPPSAPTSPRSHGSLFAAMLVATVVLSPLAILGPLIALATPLRRECKEMRILWIVALALTILVWGFALFANSGLWPDWLMFDPEEYAAS